MKKNEEFKMFLRRFTGKNRDKIFYFLK